MNRRNLLKVLPLAALAGVTVKLGAHQATAYEIKPNKKYLLVVPEMSAEHARACRALLLERGIDATICSGTDLKVYELEIAR